jgi:hypothetical protein
MSKSKLLVGASLVLGALGCGVRTGARSRRAVVGHDRLAGLHRARRRRAGPVLVQPRPVVVAPRPVYHQPTPVYAPPPVYVQPRPEYVHYRQPSRWDRDGDGIPNWRDNRYNPAWDRDGDGVPNAGTATTAIRTAVDART